MLSGLRLRLASLFTGLTGLVLAAALAATYHMAAGQYTAGQKALHEAALADLTAQLTQGRVSDAWLTRLEAEGPYLAFVEDGGALLAFPGAWQPATPRPALWRQVCRQIQLPAQTELTLTGQRGEAYEGRALTLYLGAGKACRAALLRPLAGQQEFLRRLARQHLALGLTGLAALALIAWLLTGLALGPTRRAFQRQKEFIAAASHELRSPLAVISASLQAAAEAPSPPPALLSAARREAQRMGRLVDDLLLLARADAGGWAVHKAAADLDTLCVELFDRCAPLAAQRGRRFLLDLPEEPLPPAITDPERLVQLLGIFVDNALEYTPEGTAVTLSARAVGRRVRLAVLDQGPGLSPQQQQRVWDRFYRGEAGRSAKQHFGLGLAVAKELARALGGRLFLESAPGGGAAFGVELPL